jgi:hypothetical protein
MTWALGIDQSERYSAAVLLDPSGQAVGQWCGDFGPRMVHHSVLVRNAKAWFEIVWVETEGLLMHGRVEDYTTSVTSEHLTVGYEDVGARVMNPKPAMTIRGALLSYLDDVWVGNPVLVLPGVWQAAIGYRKRGRGKDSAARRAYYISWATGAGFLPAGKMAKEREDQCAAYCVARFAQGGGTITEMDGSAQSSESGGPPAA